MNVHLIYDLSIYRLDCFICFSTAAVVQNTRKRLASLSAAMFDFLPRKPKDKYKYLYILYIGVKNKDDSAAKWQFLSSFCLQSNVEFKGNTKALQGNLTVQAAVKHVDQKRAVLDCSILRKMQRNYCRETGLYHRCYCCCINKPFLVATHVVLKRLMLLIPVFDQHKWFSIVKLKMHCE